MTVIAYCITAHKNPEQVSRLLRRIYSSSNFYYLNVFGVSSRKEKTKWFNLLNESKRNNIFVIFRYSNAYATFKLVSAILDGMTKFADVQYDYFIPISGQCYPIKSNKYIEDFLHGKDITYMDAGKIETEWPAAAERFQNLFYRVPFYGILDFAIKRGGLQGTVFGERYYGRNHFIRIPRVRKKLPCDLEPYGGSMTNCVARKHVDYILQYVRDEPEILNFFKHVRSPDEHFFQTIIMNSPFSSQVIKDSLMYFNFKVRKGEPSPAILTIADSSILIKSSKLFARKFDVQVDERILDLLDSRRDHGIVS